jgi:agmatine deiminase
MTTPRLSGFSMPPEWAPHERTWMEFPSENPTFTVDNGWLDHCRSVWTSVANTIARFEPVCMVCNVGEAEIARALLDPSIELHETPTGDAWCRDSGPTFLTHPDGRLGATHWRFNGWGDGGFTDWTDEQHVGAFIAGLAGAELFSSSMVNEGGGIHVDGDGTVMITETVQLDPGRNPTFNAEQVELELKSYLGVEQVIWLPRGLTKDYDRFGTRGHIDILTCFVRPGLVLAHNQLDPSHPDHEICAEYLGILRNSTDAKGRALEVVEVPAPATTHIDGEIVDWSYLNHYICNGAVILCTFDDPNDDVAIDILAKVYPGREIVPHDARDIFACGGGIHCITQQQPKATR